MKKKFLTFGLVAVVAAGSLFAQGTVPITGPSPIWGEYTDMEPDGWCAGAGFSCYLIHLPEIEL